VSQHRRPARRHADHDHHSHLEIERRFARLRGRVIFVTGDALDDERQSFLATAKATIIAKPLNLSDVRATVRRRLAELEDMHAAPDAEAR
jgi:hypothetical protein